MAKISSAEWEVMRVLWTKGEATSTEITKILSTKQDWSASTVKTLLGRLADKGYLTSRREGRTYLYQAVLNEEEANFTAVNEVFSKICLTKHHHLLGQLIQQIPMTREQMKDLQGILASKVSVERVQCDCQPGQCHCASHVEEEI
jgi:copper transport repressor, copY/tcrY family